MAVSGCRACIHRGPSAHPRRVLDHDWGHRRGDAIERAEQAELAGLAVARWGTSGASSLVRVVRSTARNRAIVTRYPEIFAARFPGSSRDWVSALTTGAVPPAAPGLVWADPAATRIFAWRRPTR
jgi:hypothetical protein